MNKNIVIAGSATVDKIVQKGTITVKIGGVVTYAGITFKKKNLTPIIISNVSHTNKDIIDFFLNQKIRFINGHTERTTEFINYIDEENRKQEMPCCAIPIDLGTKLKEIDRVEHIHLGPLHPEDIHPSFFKETEKKFFVSLDVQGYVRKAEQNKIKYCVSENLHDVLNMSDVIKAEIKEFGEILKTYKMTPEELIKHYNLKEIVVTTGKKGGYIVSDSGKRTEYRAHRVKKVVDTTGAGDVFFASYIASRYYRKRDAKESSNYAAYISAKHIEGNYIHQELLEINI
ncbi:TPA: hypothetical protein HA338_02305 [Methanosarcina acetivorans]|nr:PfkB family carbohydrate kinase [Methanosarcina acetivorans]HIH92905.1 hypothetical protein [Methanosarcina acetivorans]